MPAPGSADPAPERLLIVMPTWLGDCVMATPTLRALRDRFADAHIAVLIRPAMAPVLDAMPWYDQVISADAKQGVWSLGRSLRREGFDAAVLLPNSFRSAAVVRIAGIPRRIGYARDGRGWLLTDRLDPPREGRVFTPTPTLEYYLEIVSLLGGDASNRTMQLFTRAEDDAAVQAKLAEAGLIADAGPERGFLLLNVGAQKEIKRWAPDRFAAVADAIFERHGVPAAVSGSPAEAEILAAVRAAAKHPIGDLPSLGVGLKELKSAAKFARLMITNDTGPRHIAAAMDLPVVTLFGPTPPEWTTINFAKEREIVSPVKTMESITTDEVLLATEQLLAADQEAATADSEAGGAG